MVAARSPAALAADPPARKHSHVTARELSGAALLDDLRAQLDCDGVAWERLLRHRGIHVDRARLDPAALPASVPAGASVVAYLLAAEPQLPDFDASHVLLDEDGVVAIDKPPFLTVQGTRATILASLEQRLRQMLGCPSLTPAHRLDRETSGVLLFARHAAAASRLGKQFAARIVSKEYIAIVAPPPAEEAWQVTGRLVRVAHPAHSLFELRDAGPGEGAWSGTRFHVRARGTDRALVQCDPLTGRTHQLRVHLAAGSTPIVGDALYGPGYEPGAHCSADRLLLHARALTLRLDPRDEPRRIEADIPLDVASALG